MTRVSVNIATYNRNELLFGRSLPSVLRQTHRNLEINIVADGMRGEELDKLEKGLESIRDTRIRFYLNHRQSYPEDPQARWCVLGLNARNRALDVATGEWVAPLDDDDEWTNDHVEVLLATAIEKRVSFAYGISVYHWPDGHPQRAGAWPPGHFQFCDGAQIYRNGMGYRYDPRCIERGLPEDGDMWDRMVADGVSFAFIPKVVHHYYPSER